VLVELGVAGQRYRAVLEVLDMADTRRSQQRRRARQHQHKGAEYLRSQGGQAAGAQAITAAVASQEPATRSAAETAR
jgi:hypothetical protein